ncbi:para-aminobenzoate synthetase component 1 [Flavobacteriaceae bacterium MAR_2010_188]|nr:para-aminobenzoate synthetase component 1 [Flavobacteriaceae bacterium MAR_2010_188]
MRINQSQHIARPEQYKKKLLLWAQSSGRHIWLDSNGHQDKYSKYEAVLAVGAHSEIQADQTTFDSLQDFRNKTNDYIFGYLSYDLKNELEDLKSNNLDELDFPQLYFFQPKKIFFIQGKTLTASYLKDYQSEIAEDLSAISNYIFPLKEGHKQEPIKIKMRIFKDEYFKKLEQMLFHIHRGDIYEANLCQEFYAENYNLDPVNTFFKLTEISEAPFSAYLKLEDKYVISASPERYLQRVGTQVISQPIKGTARRSNNPEEDQKLKNQLSEDEKELSENIMIVDMVRNDLSQTSIKGSVKVEELCKVYSYKQVHQMISTISSQVHPDADSVEIIKSTFPMGSMTGAPKISAMKIIEQLEETKRGLYSGAIGYFEPNGDFDFNVVIRSILYNKTKKYVSFSVGSAITAKSDADKEYEECLIKAKAMRDVLEGN